MFLAFYTNLAELLSTRSGIFAALIPLILAMLIIRWWDSKLGVPSYASLKNEQRIWLTLHFLPPKTSARTGEGLGEKRLRACMDSSKETVNSIVRYKKELIEDFLNRYDKLGKEALDVNIVGCADAFEALGRIYEDREAELSADLLAVWPLQEEGGSRDAEASSAGGAAEGAAEEHAVPSAAEKSEAAETASPEAAEKPEKAEADSGAEKSAEPTAEPSEKAEAGI